MTEARAKDVDGDWREVSDGMVDAWFRNCGLT